MISYLLLLILSLSFIPLHIDINSLKPYLIDYSISIVTTDVTRTLIPATLLLLAPFIVYSLYALLSVYMSRIIRTIMCLILFSAFCIINDMNSMGILQLILPPFLLLTIPFLSRSLAPRMNHQISIIFLMAPATVFSALDLSENITVLADPLSSSIIIRQYLNSFNGLIIYQAYTSFPDVLLIASCVPLLGMLNAYAKRYLRILFGTSFLLLTALALTLSRTSTLVSVILFVVLILSWLVRTFLVSTFLLARKNILKKSRFILLSGLFSIFPLLYSLAVNFVGPWLQSIFDELIYKLDFLEGFQVSRGSKWQESLNTVFSSSESLLFGTAYSSPFSHNIILDILFRTGLVGLTLLPLSYFYALRDAIHITRMFAMKLSGFRSIPFIYFIIILIVGNFFNTSVTQPQVISASFSFLTIVLASSSSNLFHFEIANDYPFHRAFSSPEWRNCISAQTSL